MEERKKREELLRLIKEKEPVVAKFNRYIGGGIAEKLRRILAFGPNYAAFYILKAFTPAPRGRLFFGKRFFSTDGGTHLVGFMPDVAELKLTKFLIKNLKEDAVFYDVGAHVGFYTMLAEEMLTSGEIHAFEPNPKTFPVLFKNTSSFGNVHVNQVAVSDVVGTADFYADLKKLSTGSGFYESAGYKKVTVRAVTLDEYAKTHRSPSLIKIDVEGAEEKVIRGARRMLQEKNPIVIIEVWEKNNDLHKKAIRELYSLGYQSYRITSEGDMTLFENMDRSTDIARGISFDNFVFVKEK